MKSLCGFAIASILLCQTAYPEDLLRIPATSYAVEDQLTGIKVTVLIGDFQISPTEVTQREFREIMNYNPSFYKGEDRPVENVTWWEAIRYCNLRSLKERLEPCYNLATGECDLSKNGYRLPTDTEWSYASGPETDIDPGKIHQHANIGSKDTKHAELLIKAIKEVGTKRVASYQPNRFGL